MAEEKKRTITRAGETAPKKTSEKKTVQKAETKVEQQPQINQAKPTGSATPYRLAAIGLWLVGLAMEVLAILTIMGKLPVKGLPTLAWFIIFLVINLIVVIIGSQLWKKANHIKPASKKNPVLFWLWNNMGVIVSVICFAPIIVLLLTQKDLDKKTKIIGVVAAAVALLIAGVASYDFNPISAEQLNAAEQVVTGDVYWSPFGKVYHTHEDCGSLNHSDSLTVGDVDQAVAAGRTRLCMFCARRDNINTEGLLTDGAVVTDEALQETVATLPDAA